MSKHKHDAGKIPHLHLSGEEDEDREHYDDDEVEVIRPHAPRGQAANAGRRSMQHDLPQEHEEGMPLSKTKIKQQMHELRDLGKELTALSADQLDQLELPENLHDAICEMKRIHKFGAQRRQLQYIGKLMREVEAAPILAKLDAWKGKSQQYTAYMHLLERWRNRLLENDSALTELLAAYPAADTQRLHTLLRNAKKEREAGKPPKNFREIYQLLREIIPEPAS